MIRRHRFAFALLVLIATVIFAGPLLRQEVFTIRDHLDYFQPLRWFTAEALKSGHLPLWNPYSASGEPWLGNPQTGVFYPPTWIFLVLPFPTAYMLFLLFHLVVLGWSSYLLFVRNASPGAAMVGATAMMLCGPTLSLLDINNNLATLAWLPLVLWCAAERAWRRGAVALALAFLGGEPFFAAVGAVMFVIVAGRSLKTTALAGLGAIGLSAVQLGPFLEALRDSDRVTGMKGELILRDSMPLADWLRIAIPPTFQRSAFDPSLGQHFIPVIYMGMLVVALALLGLLSIRRRHVIGWVALLAVVVIVAMGPALLLRMPVTFFRYPARLVPLGALAIAGLAVAGWDRFRAGRRWVDLIVIALVLVDLVPRARPLLETAPFRRDIVPYPAGIGADMKFLRIASRIPAERESWISGYLNLYGRRFDADSAAPFSTDRYVRFHRAVLESPTPAKVRALAAGYMLTSIPLPQGLQLIGRSGHVRAYGDPNGWPMARMSAGGTLVRPERVEMTTHSAKIVIDAPSEGVVVITQQHAPGWTVAVDGQSRAPLVVEGIFRGVEVSKGRHEIVWTYRPQTLFGGAVVSLLTTLTLQISVLVKRRREEKFFFLSLES
jgi:hypothetical protein